MIFITGYGQMCNNILQFGHVYAWAKERGVKTVAMRFCYKYPYFAISSLRGYNIFTYLFAKYGAKAGLIPRVDFNGEQPPDASILHRLLTERFIVAGGWEFRDYDAFLRNKDQLRKLFAFRPSIVRRVDASLPAFTQGIRLGVHVRRGDYARWHGGRYLYSDADYLAIIRSFAAAMPGQRLQIIIATNDASLSADVYRKALDCDVFAPGGNAAEDLYALSTCHYIISPPGTFSLVASFYNDTPLYWITDKHEPPAPHAFRTFNELFRQII